MGPAIIQEKSATLTPSRGSGPGGGEAMSDDSGFGQGDDLIAAQPEFFVDLDVVLAGERGGPPDQ